MSIEHYHNSGKFEHNVKNPTGCNVFGTGGIDRSIAILFVSCVMVCICLLDCSVAKAVVIATVSIDFGCKLGVSLPGEGGDSHVKTSGVEIMDFSLI